MTQQTPAPGWYPDPSNPQRQIYWDGTAWSGPPAPSTKADAGKKTAIAVGVSILCAVGLFMSMQSASLLTGSGPIWTGVAVVGAGAAIAFFMGATKWVRVVASVCLVFAFFNGFYMEKQMSDMRNEITQIFDS